ncbi:MAG TPA: TonB-dependent receptor [Usitatibacter sp.]|nr:TonB-dependent receptor [Usitatibacter sp.]
MNRRKNTLAVAVAGALALASSGAATNAFAQQASDAPASKERIEVTGSSIKRVEGETALPVTVISRDEIDKSGATSPMELLQLLSANNSVGSVSLTSTIGATTNSAQTANLRGLQGGHTLVLINGKRVNGFAGEVQGVQGVNLAIIPFSAIERVEVLKDGASAVYGSDAIAGVINFIMRSDYRGGEVNVFYGKPTRSGGGDQQKVDASLGFGDLNKDRYNVFANASYMHQKSLDQRDRSFSDDSTNQFIQLGGFAGSSNTYPGNITTGGIHILGSTATTCGPVPENVFVPLLGGCFFDPAHEKGVESIPEDKQSNFFVQGKFQINADWQAYATGLYSEDTSRLIIQGTPISNGITWGPHGGNIATVLLQPTSQYYPHDAAVAAGVDGQALNVRWRTTPLGLRDTTDTNTGWQVTGGVKGTIAERWDADVSYSYSEGKVVEHVNGGFFLYSQLLPLLNSGNYNIVGLMPQDQVNAINSAAGYAQDVFTGQSKTSALNAKISGELMQMAAGPLAGAFGIDLRRENLDQTPSAAFEAGDITGYGGSAGAVHGSRDVSAFYAELNVPVLKTLELDAAVRSDHYSDFGSTTNPKVSLRFQPSQRMLLRASYGQGFLAPSLYELFVPQTSGLSPTGLNDPLRCPITHDNTLDCNAQFPTTAGGNPNLKPEKSEQATFGVVLEPIDNLSVSADYFKIRLNEAITNGIPITTILSDPQYYNQITRAPSDPNNPNLPGRITAIQQTYINLGDTHIEGWDIEAHYKWPRMSWGRVRFDLAGTYYTRYDFENLDGTYTGQVSNAFNSPVIGVVPRWKHYAAFSWDSGPWSATFAQTFQTTYVDSQTDLNGDQRRVSSMSLFDLQGSYTGVKNLKVTLGVKNLFDTNPPQTNQQNVFTVGFDPSYYDARARFVYVQVGYGFK